MNSYNPFHYLNILPKEKFYENWKEKQKKERKEETFLFIQEAVKKCEISLSNIPQFILASFDKMEGVLLNSSELEIFNNFLEPWLIQLNQRHLVFFVFISMELGTTALQED